MKKADYRKRMKARMNLVQAEAELVLSDINDSNYRIDERIDGIIEQLEAVKTELKAFREATG